MESDIIQELFENAQFILLLRDQVEHIVGDTIVKRNETKQSGDMVDEINTYIGNIIEFTAKQ